MIQKLIMTTKKQEVYDFFQTHTLLPSRNYQHAVFCEEHGKISKRYFNGLARKYSKTVSLKTGGVNAKTSKIVECIIERTNKGVNYSNTLSYDEKVFAPRNYVPSSVTVGITHTGPVPSNFIKFQHTEFFTLQMIITSDAILFWRIIKGSVNKELFNKFFIKIISLIPNDFKTRFIVLDNASFHQIEEKTHQLYAEKNIEFLFNPPLCCFLNPIEEVFSWISAKVNERIEWKILANRNIENQKSLIDIVKDILNQFDVGNDYPFKKVFIRACILPPDEEF